VSWTPSDEGRHDGARGVETWSFSFDGGVAVCEIRLAFDIEHGRASFLTDCIIDSVGRVVVADESVPLPRAAAGLEVRADGLWASLLCETPFEHWSLGLEAFGLRVDDVRDDNAAWADLMGERIAVGFDLEWELTGPPEPLVDGDGYRQPGTMFGDLLVVRDRIAVDAPAWRDHSWGA
jgi:hypothetical protein